MHLHTGNIYKTPSLIKNSITLSAYLQVIPQFLAAIASATNCGPVCLGAGIFPKKELEQVGESQPKVIRFPHKA